jgi:tetratricopeptide (TPR) repeat protein
MLLTALSFGDAVETLTDHGEGQTLVELARRTICIEDNPGGPAALAAFVRSSGSAPHIRRSLSYELASAARGWKSPGAGLYSAGSLLGQEDAERALTLMDDAAAADPRYLDRGYWWREKGSLNWSLQNVEEAERCYEMALSFGEDTASALLADVYLFTGRYLKARDQFKKSPIWEDPLDAQWRLSLYGVDYIVERLEVQSQRREGANEQGFEPSADGSDAERAMATIGVDALDGWAHMALSYDARERADDEASVYHAILAALIMRGNPAAWLDLVVTVVGSTAFEEPARLSLSFDAMTCAWQYFGQEFADFVLEDESMPSAPRESLIEFFEDVRPEAHPSVLRFHGGDGTETYSLPSRRLSSFGH